MQIEEMYTGLLLGVEAIKMASKEAVKSVQGLGSATSGLKLHVGVAQNSYVELLGTVEKVFVGIKRAVETGSETYESFMNTVSNFKEEMSQETVLKFEYTDNGYTLTQTHDLIREVRSETEKTVKQNKEFQKTYDEIAVAAEIAIEKGKGKMEEFAEKISQITQGVNSYIKSLLDMESYTDSFSSMQADLNDTYSETKELIGESLSPLYTMLAGIINSVFKAINGLVSAFPSLSTGLISAVAAGLGIMKVLTSLIKIFPQLGAAMSSNAVGIWVAAIAAAIGAVAALFEWINKKKEAAEKAAASQERYNEVLEGTFAMTEKNKELVNEEIAAAEEYLEVSERKKAAEEERLALEERLKELKSEKGVDNSDEKDEIKEKIDLLKDEEKELKKTIKANVNKGSSLDEAKVKLEAFNGEAERYKMIESANEMLDADRIRTIKKEAAELKVNAAEKRELLETVKNSEKGTREYIKAQEELARFYPELASAEGIIIDEAEHFIKLEEEKADAAWDSAEDTVNAYNAIINEAKNSEEFMKAMMKETGLSAEDLVRQLENVGATLAIIGGKSPEDLAGNKEGRKNQSTARSSGGGSYKNAALDNYKKDLKNKKSLDQLSIEDEIKGYEYALSRLAKTNDEKMDLEIELHKLRKELSDKLADDETKTLAKRRNNSEKWIEDQAKYNKEEFNIEERKAAYDRIINYHRDYLGKILNDERISAEKKKEIQEETLNTIKEYTAKMKDQEIDEINRTTDAIESALVERANKQQKLAEDQVKDELKRLEKVKKEKIKSINDEYNAKIKSINDELKALDDAEKKRSRMEEDADYNKKRKRLEELIKYEQDTVTKASYELELAKLNESQNKNIDKRSLEDEKERLREEAELLKDQQTKKLENLEETYEKDREFQETELENIKNHYDDIRDNAKNAAQAMMMDAEANQEKIIELLGSYGDRYSIIGQTFGEKVANGFSEQVEKIEKVVDTLASRINRLVNNDLKSMANKAEQYARYSGSTSQGSSSKSIVINQSNTIQSAPDRPSDLYKKFETTSKSVAAMIV